MLIRDLARLAIPGLALLFIAAEPHAAFAQDAALSGQVTSAAEGAMEGVIVSAKRDGSNMTVSVITNEQGRYAFPAGRLEPGRYAVQIRAVGYELDGPKSANVAPGQPSTLDLKLRKTQDLSKQLTNAEWMMSIPGTDDDKATLLNCVSCHRVERIMRSTHTVDEFVQVIARMNGYAQVSQPIKPQRRIDQARAANPERFRKAAEYLATINLSTVPRWQYELKTLPRVTGRGTRAIITEYDLPRPTIEPHDVIVLNGTVWYTNFGEQFLGKLDPKTGKNAEFALPVLKPGFPTGNLDLEVDKSGNLWTGMMYQGAIAKFDPKTETFRLWQLPADRNRDNSQLNMVTMSFDVDGKVWTNDAGTSNILRLDLNTGKFEEFDPLAAMPTGKAGHSIYDVRADSQNNVYLTEFQRNNLARIDAKTGKFTFYQLPTNLSRNRRGRLDNQDRFWFAEYRGNKIAMFDTKTEKFQEFPLPTKFTSPYDVVVDKNGEAWTGGMTTDRVVRLDTKTGHAVEYPLPRDTNMRRMFVDNSTTPVTFWVGSNHGASIVHVEPLD
jgi:streptogramin lyase